MCSCIFTTGADRAYGTSDALKLCLTRGNLPVPIPLVKLLEMIQVGKASVKLKASALDELLRFVSKGDGEPGWALYDRDHLERGCSLEF
jgi:hypothetical protein